VRSRPLVALSAGYRSCPACEYWTQYREAISGAQSEDLTDLRFLIHGIDPGVPNVRLIQEFPKLSAFCRGVFCLSTEAALIQRQFYNTGIQGVGVVARPGEAETYLIERLGRLHAATRNSGLESFVLAASKPSTVVNAIGAGVRYIEGAGMRRAVADPRFAVAQDLLDYYRLAKGACVAAAR
jgi:hypothetical protein